MTTVTKGNHADQAAEFIANSQRTQWHDQALWFVRAKRDKAAQSVPEWEQLRELASQIKLHTLSRLPEYLEQFEEQATRQGAHVHWARDAEDHNRIVLRILQESRDARFARCGKVEFSNNTIVFERAKVRTVANIVVYVILAAAVFMWADPLHLFDNAGAGLQWGKRIALGVGVALLFLDYLLPAVRQYKPGKGRDGLVLVPRRRN